MKLYNVIANWDVYVVAETGEAARLAILEMIKSGDLGPSHLASFDVATTPIRPAWQDERPIVAEDVSEADFERLKGKTTQQVADLLLKKQR